MLEINYSYNLPSCPSVPVKPVKNLSILGLQVKAFLQEEQEETLVRNRSRQAS